MNELIDKTATIFARTCKEVRVRCALAPHLWTTEVDRGQMERVLMNLYVNAGQAMPGGGELRLTALNVVLDDREGMITGVAPGRYVLISVADDGVGMDEGTMARIFAPFFTTKAMGRGTGLGLATVYGIIKGHGGIITVESAPAAGTTFRIYLPASEKASHPVSAADQLAPILTGSETILLVDDEEAILAVNREMLTALGYRVITAGSG
ncbi:MAG: ATP-binding protein [Syntrophales bacterium]|nr:ATP-binding protein [Syntrophales bacterium]